MRCCKKCGKIQMNGKWQFVTPIFLQELRKKVTFETSLCYSCYEAERRGLEKFYNQDLPEMTKKLSVYRRRRIYSS